MNSRQEAVILLTYRHYDRGSSDRVKVTVYQILL